MPCRLLVDLAAHSCVVSERWQLQLTNLLIRQIWYHFQIFSSSSKPCSHSSKTHTEVDILSPKTVQNLLSLPKYLRYLQDPRPLSGVGADKGWGPQASYPEILSGQRGPLLHSPS